MFRNSQTQDTLWSQLQAQKIGASLAALELCENKQMDKKDILVILVRLMTGR